MAARGILQHVLLDTTGAPIPNRAVQILKPDGTAFAGTFYDAVSGGSSVPANGLTSDDDGLVRYWTGYADIKRVLVRTTGADDTISQFFHAPEDILTQGMAVPAVLDGYAGSLAALRVRSENQILLETPDANKLFKTGRTSGNDFVSINLLNGTLPTLNLFEVRKASSTTGFNMADFELQTTAGGIIQSTVKSKAIQTVAGISNIAAFYGHAERSGSATADGVARVFEAHLKTTVNSNTSPGFVAGFKVISDVDSTVKTGTAFHAGGPGAGVNYLLYGADAADAGYAYIDSTGILNLAQISTPSAPAFGTSLYMKSGGGLYTRATGGAEKQHKAGGQSGISVGTTGSVTTTSASYTDLLIATAGNPLAVTLTTIGGDLLVWFTGTFQHSDATSAIVVALSLDGAAEAFSKSIAIADANEAFDITVIGRFTGVAAGSHTVKVRWLTGASTATSLSAERYLIVQELPS